jgi:lipopolysaccharide export LptBFGC system permease protein LptF
MKIKDYAMYILGTLITLCFFFILALLVFRPVPEENNNVLYLIIGALIGYMGSIVTYFFGSSAGSAEKSEIISKIAESKNNGKD